ncbi:molybdopterin-guanine dinucleotide biosynthesis protein B [Peribacillus asahii]|uniref:molybdopterin-guanine dinucleotide biosynthesis protein B n=1 Tax=Peribacillus asahii TaxID=228899 RepID=UPI00207A8AAC|nr:molybdopterin-guanine dinucleotide biosynthesis protein B [Peribacillus asahii]USK59232.1 molybdopterin-guanine dinucleotide biosynthesis protein B [Peribacillus asahii]
MALGKYCPILQVVGYQNSGKTTLMEKLISRAAQVGLRAASIKHHGHGGAPSYELPSKDSLRHYEAGAVVSSVEGGGTLQLRAKMDDLNLEEMLRFYQFFSIDVIFVEGYKRESYPKVVLLRDEQDLSILDSLTNVQCIISHVQLDQKLVQNYKVFQLNEDHLYIDFLMEVVNKDGVI